MTILLSDIWQIESPQDFKVHFARWNSEVHPLDAWLQDHDNWRYWQEFRPARNEFNRPYIFSMMQFYHDPDAWIFGGIFKIIERHVDRYVVEQCDAGVGFIGRLKLTSPYRSRATRVNFENHYAGLEVSEILREPYTGRQFPGYEEIDLSFGELEALISTGHPGWKAALESVKGVYLITDEATGKRYVGSAYGDQGIWARWCEYVESGHGGNAELRSLVADHTLGYCRSNFRFALLEHRAERTPDDHVLRREQFWKKILLTRGKQGLNRN